jgi:homoaconitate hydratase
MGQTVVEKIAQAHLAQGPARPLRAGDMVSLRPRHILTHDNTSAVLKKFASLGATRVFDRRQPVFALDHEIQNRSEPNLAKYREIEAFAAAQGIAFHPAGEGIGHQLMVERGYALPGALVVASDSHANMYGAVGALGTPVVRTDAACVWATGEFWWQIPRTIQVLLTGALRPGVTGKDVILTLCGLYPGDEVLNAAIEFAGPGVASLTMDARLTIANMTTEWGALTGWFPVDDVTHAFLAERHAVLDAGRGRRFDEDDLARWRAVPPTADAGAAYAGVIRLDLGTVEPQVAGPDQVRATRPLAEVQAEARHVDKAYLLSCVNGRLEDLEAAAAVVAGRTLAPGLRFFVAAASREVQQRAEASGAWQKLLAAGAEPLEPGCGPCIGLGLGLLEPDEVGISATNRNFKGRMGARSAVAYLASPAVVAASAVAGRITGPNGPSLAVARPAGRARQGNGALPRSWTPSEIPAPADEAVAILPGFPERMRGRLLFVPRDNLDTDGIYGKDFTYRELSWAEMARVVMANYDPEFASRAADGDILVGGANFGTGSSREQAATALQARGIALVIADSFSQTFQRNAFNNGFLCVECPELVRQLRAWHAAEVAAGVPTLIPGDRLDIDFAHGTIQCRDVSCRFPPLGSVPQELVIAGGVENLVRARLQAEPAPHAGAPPAQPVAL